MTLRIETHRVADGDAVHLVLGDVGVDLPVPRVDEDAQWLLAVDPLAGLPVGIEVEPGAGERRLQVQPGDFRAGGAGLFELHIEALAGGGLFGQPRRIGQQSGQPRLVTAGVGFAAGNA